MKEIIVEFKSVGIIEIYIDRVIEKWNHLWWIAQWKEEYRLVKYVRKGSPNTKYKFTISKKQAHELIGELDLKPESGGFNSATSWR